MIRLKWYVLLVCLACLAASTASAQPIFHIVTDRGNLFEIEPADRTPTTDIVSSPYIEFQRVGGVVVSGGVVREAVQYNKVSSGPTYIISNWADGTTYGIPNGAPLAGEMRMSPTPHLYLRTPQPISGNLWPAGISHVEIMSGNLMHSRSTHLVHGDYHTFQGSGRAIIWLDDINSHYAINMVCPDCQTDTPAVVGTIKDDGVGPKSGILGTDPISIAPIASIPCTISGINHTGCGIAYLDKLNSTWPMSPRPDIDIHDNEEDETKPEPVQFGAILNITRYDTTNCPGANHTNTEMEMLNDTMFRMMSHGCIMQNYSYQWWDNVIKLENFLPLRAGLNIWEDPTGGSDHPAIILNMRSGKITLQAYATTSALHANQAFYNALTVDPGSLIGSDSLVILHDSFSHLGAYTRANIHKIADHVRTYPQLQSNSSVILTAHSAGSGPNEFGGVVGKPCHGDYKYCITIFDDRDLPVVNNAAGVVYDPRNGVELNRGHDVDNHQNVFVSVLGTPPVPGTILYDATKLNLVQAYAVIPVSGSVDVKELYVMAGYGSHNCDRYIDTTTQPHSWTAPSASGWMQLEYLETEYGGEYTAIHVPVLPWYDTICMRTHGNNEFRQFKMDNFFVVGDHASFGGTKHIRTYHLTQHQTTPTFRYTVLDTDVVLPGSGIRTMDLDVSVDVSVIMLGLVENGGSATVINPTIGDRDKICDWGADSFTVWNGTSRTDPANPRPYVNVRVYVEIDVPKVGGYERLNIPVARGVNYLTEHDGFLPTTVGADCMEQLDVTWNFKPSFHTIPVEYDSNTPVKIRIETHAWLGDTIRPQFAGYAPDETIYVETYIDRLSVRVH